MAINAIAICFQVIIGFWIEFANAAANLQGERRSFPWHYLQNGEKRRLVNKSARTSGVLEGLETIVITLTGDQPIAEGQKDTKVGAHFVANCE